MRPNLYVTIFLWIAALAIIYFIDEIAGEQDSPEFMAFAINYLLLSCALGFQLGIEATRRSRA